MSKYGIVAALLSGSHFLCSDTLLESCQITTVFVGFFIVSAVSLSGTRVPLTCPEGTFTPANMTGLWNEKECLPCLPGHYCRL